VRELSLETKCESALRRVFVVNIYLHFEIHNLTVRKRAKKINCSLAQDSY